MENRINFQTPNPPKRPQVLDNWKVGTVYKMKSKGFSPIKKPPNFSQTALRSREK